MAVGLHSWSYRLKRGFDFLAALALLIVLAPVFAAFGLLLRLEGGTAFFSHRRVGRNGRPFACHKFRTMVPDAEARLAHVLATDPAAREEWARDFKLKNDPRVTALGEFLRLSSLDELPQLWNVLVGQMSLVGPRPVVQAELERYGDAAALYLQVRPGLTGLWQVSGRNDTSYEERVRLDAEYVCNWSFALDLRILFRTVGVVIGRRGAY